MKKTHYTMIFLCSLVIVGTCAGILLLYRHVFGDQKIKNSVTTTSNTFPITDQSIKNDSEGYAFHVPKTWYVEENSSDMIVVYPDYSPTASSSAVCKIEMSVFAYLSQEKDADWIVSRLGADPTITVAEQSSENITIGDASGIKWSGTMNNIPTTIVYAFTPTHAYEIVPSVIDESAQGAGECDEYLDLFLKNITLN